MSWFYLLDSFSKFFLLITYQLIFIFKLIKYISPYNIKFGILNLHIHNNIIIWVLFRMWNIKVKQKCIVICSVSFLWCFVILSGFYPKALNILIKCLSLPSISCTINKLFNTLRLIKVGFDEWWLTEND